MVTAHEELLCCGYCTFWCGRCSSPQVKWMEKATKISATPICQHYQNRDPYRIYNVQEETK